MPINAGDGFEITELTESPALQQIQIAYQYYTKQTYVAWADADGVSSKTMVVPLARNALVREYKVRIGAVRADGITLANAGQVRLQAEVSGSKIIVVDFGMLRTVSGVGRVEGVSAPSMTICSLRAFRGDAFEDKDLYHEDCGGFDILIGRPPDANVFETRTDRVRLTVKTTASLETIANALFLLFPDLPSDLDIRVNGGAPPFTAPGVAQPNVRGWDANTQQVADLTAAMQALGGDPHDPTPLDATIVLSSRVPGLLALAQETSDIAFLARIAFGDAEETTIALDQEGTYDVVLAMPAWVKHVQEVRFTITGTVPAERVLEPVGPPPALMSGGGGVAYDLLLDVDHAGAARLDSATPFAEITGIRLPLRAGPDGAEVRIVLHEGTTEGPTKPVDGGTSKPINLDPADAADVDVWTTFPMPKPVKRKADVVYWVVVVVGRGAASWSLGQFANEGVAVPIRRGVATGPWHQLPTVTLPGTAAAGARVRVVGKAPPTAPVAPLVASIAGHENRLINVTPTPKGIAAAWLAGPASGTTHPSITPNGTASAPTITLRFTSRMTGSIKLGAVDVVAIKT